MLIPGLSNKDAESVFVGTVAASEVYLGATKVWPTFVAVETLITTAGPFTYPVPLGCTKIDVVLIGGGRGGDAAALTIDGSGGKCGVWNSKTWIVGVDVQAGGNITGTVGAGGAGGDGILIAGDAGKSGGTTTVGSVTAAGGSNFTTGRDGESPNAHTFNGRTYAGGSGGAGPYEDGSAGGPPGGGGQGGKGSLVGSKNGGAGGSGGCYLYFY